MWLAVSGSCCLLRVSSFRVLGEGGGAEGRGKGKQGNVDSVPPDFARLWGWLGLKGWFEVEGVMVIGVRAGVGTGFEGKLSWG